MQIKRFEAQDMTSALRLIKEEFGSEAVILSARSLKADRGILGIPKRPAVEVTAAIDSSYCENRSKMRPTGQAGGLALSGRVRSKRLEKKNPVASFQERMRLFGTKRGTGSDRAFPFSAEPGESQSLQRSLIARGVDKTIAMDIAGNLMKIKGATDVSSARELKPYLPSILKKMGVIAGPVTIGGGGQKIIALIGPTGVGKTTTIAKLAAATAIHGQGRIALLSTDHCRIGAVEQLRTYAGIIGVPMGVALNNRELREFVRGQRDKGLILVDTSGVCHRDDPRISELRKILGSRATTEIHLVLSATTKEEDLIEIWERFSVFSVKRLIFTKLDETSSYGPLFNLAVRSRVPVSFMTSGQEVPEDIEMASLEKLSGLILGLEQRDVVAAGTAADTVRREKLLTERDSRVFCVANKNSDVFHRPDCTWVKKIKEENMVVLKSVSDAINSRLKPCRLCNPAKGVINEAVRYGEEVRKRATGR